jgi:hypothetical protein
MKRAQKSLDKCFRILSAIQSEQKLELEANNQQRYICTGREYAPCDTLPPIALSILNVPTFF